MAAGVALPLVCALLAGCSGVQSALDPAGPDAALIGQIGWIMTAGGAAIFVLVLALTAWALYAPPAARTWLGSKAAVVVGGIAFPVVVLAALLVYGLALAGHLVSPPAGEPLRIAVVGERWWWRVHYLGEDGSIDVVSANEVRIPTGRPVEFLLRTADLIHSFWIPSLDGKLDMIPGRENSLVLEAARPGIYRGQCAEYCGAQHAHMAFDVVAYAPAEFENWLAAEREPAEAPADGFLAQGQKVFLATGCGACHTIRGTDAIGTIGPDLTHVSNRLSLAAGTLANNQGAFAAWLAHSQRIKPGNLMPSFEILAPEDLRALAAYLESLK
ncbi:MAG TPA: cytochrome c oxidase subunit II [Propylenella sp.]|nr:cytochrome c oxidase subunit II [Propylenella sp.]